MSITFTTGRKAPAKVPAVIHGVPSDRLSGAPGGVDEAGLKALGFEGKSGQVQVLPGAGGTIVVLVGLGESAKVDTHAVRKAAGNAARRVKSKDKVATTLVTDVEGLVDAGPASAAVAEGLRLGAYTFDTHKPSATRPALASVTVIGGDKAAVARAAVIADAVCYARDLVNEPGGLLTAPVFADRIAAAARGVGVKAKVMDEAAIRKARLGGLLGVNRGSEQPPRFIELTYEPAKATASTPTLAFIGKGITFDSGGLDIKPVTGMATMKCDMGGAAAVAGALLAIGQVGAPVRVKGYIPTTDNMTGGDATRPGDVLTYRNGKTVEIGNTDAEGRLILADALCLASEAKVSAIVDLATLTGACMVALGDRIAGLMANDDALADQVAAAAATSGEPTWRLPLPPEYRPSLDSPVADMKNIGGPYGGALTAGLFLKEFVAEGIPWVHLDIAGPAFVDWDDGEITKGGAGWGVRTLVELATTYSA